MAGTPFKPYTPNKPANDHDLVVGTIGNFVSGGKPAAESAPATGAVTPAAAPSSMETSSASQLLSSFSDDPRNKRKQFLGM